jgi:hypothetical protein
MYSAHEMMFDHRQKGPESCYSAGVDTWSMGAIAYELRSGNYMAFATSEACIMSHCEAVLGQLQKRLSLGPRQQGCLLCVPLQTSRSKHRRCREAMTSR